MCLATPCKVVKVEDEWATVQSQGHTHKANLSLLKDVKAGDYLLVHNDLALNRVPKEDAKKILDFLEDRENDSKISGKNRRFKDLTRDNIINLLKSQGSEKEDLFAEANRVRKENIKDFICIHGIIEFSNYCKNDCVYCGLRRENRELKRYRMSVDEIVKTAQKAAHDKGYKLLVLQSGEDIFYTDEMLVEMIERIKKACRVFIFVSVGERGHDCYKKMKEAGASGALFRFETSNPRLFKKLHLNGKSFKNRFEHLKFIKELGYFLATGSISGLPGQTTEDLADDILMMKKWAHMVSMGPYVPVVNTPLGKSEILNQKSERAEINLKMIAILRLLMPHARIPVVTALETLLGEEGRKRALMAGANSLMFNLTPAKYRPHYKIYGDKFYQKEDFWEKYGLFKYEESYKMLEERMVKEIKQWGK